MYSWVATLIQVQVVSSEGKTGSPCLSDALLGAMNKIRMATRDSDLYGVIDEEKIYQEREDDW